MLIVPLATDAVVNAANEGLRAGGGIYGYPLRVAWEQAISACSDFISEHL